LSSIARCTARVLAPLALLAVAACFGACGGGIASDAKAYGPGPRGIDEALADLDASEAEIASRFGYPAGQAGYAQPYGYSQPGYPQPGYGGQPAQPAPQPAAPPGTTPPQEQPKGPWAEPPADPAAGAPAPPPPMAPAEPSAAPTSGGESAEREAEQRCAIACRALGSMKRAAEHVCRAAGSTDVRCARARDRVTSASARVAEACEDCDG
jgi:hypothetical protein